MKIASTGKIIAIQNEIKMLQIVKDGITIAKTKCHVGTNISQEGYIIMDLTHMWVKSEISRLKEKQNGMLQVSEF